MEKMIFFRAPTMFVRHSWPANLEKDWVKCWNQETGLGQVWNPERQEEMSLLHYPAKQVETSLIDH